MISLVLPPLTQLSTPYPSTAYLSRCLRRAGIAHTQRDLGLEFFLKIFSKDGLSKIFDHLEQAEELPDPAWQALALRQQHVAAIGPVLRFLQGKDRTLAAKILDTPFLPRGPRLAAVDLALFGEFAVDDAARHLATLYIEDLADLVTSCVDPGFGLARYQHHLGVGPASYDALHARLQGNTLLDQILDALSDSLVGEVVGLSVPFPGTLYGALRIGKRLKARGVYVVMGGGYVNTELRAMTETRLWECVDALCYDDGEGPLLALLEWRQGGPDRRHRTLCADGMHNHAAPDVPAEFASWYGDLPLDKYLALIDGVNPAHRLWSDGRWNKLTLAHGCYWKKCSFCDIQLDYIRHYVPHRAIALVDAMEELIAATGQSGFHMVDEAAPPKGMREVGLEILSRQLAVSWWGNIRFDEAFTPDLCRMLAASGLIAVTGGLEVASDRLLKKMQKGVSIEQVARVAKAFRDAGVLVHAYLMYGFPTQTVQETVDAMEIVRQLFEAGVISSAFWHRFVLTRHSGMYPQPQAYGIEIIDHPNAFAQNDLEHRDPQGGDHDRFDQILPEALKAWMQGQDLDRPVHHWAPGLPPSQESPQRIRQALLAPVPDRGQRLIWLGGDVLAQEDGLLLHHLDHSTHLRIRPETAEVVGSLLQAARPDQPPLNKEDVSVPPKLWERLRKAGLVVV